MTATVWLVPHTHWDREWYEPFQQFRLRLVDLMDDVVARAQREPRFRFTMDGQMAAVDDYLEVRPEQTEAVRALVAGGQLAVGPWRVLMDEFLCSGETMIRNLEIGWADASRLGPVMAVGYLPDMFGHCAQMPQILRRAGIERACVWRGVPSEVDAGEFWWKSPDGTGIRTEYLANSYGNAADVFGHGGDTRQRVSDRLRSQSHWYAGADFLAMYGTDHAAPLPTLMSEVDALNTDGGERVRVATLTEYLGATGGPEDALRVVAGELRSHAHANILPGVLSVRWHLKEAMARTERLLARYAEPFAALLLPVQPAHYLSLAWRGVVDSSCHDSVTGCGVDDTAVQVLARIEEAEHAARAVRDRALATAAALTPTGSLVVANPLPVERHDVVEATVPVPEEWRHVGFALPDGSVVPAQEVSRPDPELAREIVAADDLARLMHRVHDRELFGLQVARIDVDTESRCLTFLLADRGDAGFDAIAAEQRLRAAAEAATNGEPGAWEVVTRDEPRRRLAARLPSPALGWVAATPVESAAAPVGAPVRQDDRALANGLVSVSVEPDGSLTVAGRGATLTGVGRLVDGGDCGDSYNYGPPRVDALVDDPCEVAVTASGAEGPVVGRLRVERRYDLPTCSDRSGRSSSAEPTLVGMDVEVREGEPFVRLSLDWENRTRDHRLRLHVPTATPAEHSDAQGQLAVVRRGRGAEGGPVGEYPLPTFPAERFVDAGGVGVVLGRTMEYEVVDAPGGGTEIALTLVRSIGYLSRNVHPYRSEPAGPQLPTPAAQVLGPCRATFAVVPHQGSWADAGHAGLGDVAEAFLHPVTVLRGTGTPGARPESFEGLHVGGAGVDLLSVRRRDDADPTLEVRVVNSSDESATAVLGSPRARVITAARSTTRGEFVDELTPRDGVVELPLRPWEIATVQVMLEGAPAG